MIMNPISFVMACFSVLGALDLIIGNKFGLGKEFERGLMLLGTMALSMVGMIVLAPSIARLIAPVLTGVSKIIPFFEPSSVVGLLIANDMGGATLAQELAKTPEAGYFNGLIVGSMMGATISFTIPFAMGIVAKEQHDLLTLGLMCGIVTIPLGCFVSGLMCGLPFVDLLASLIPLLLFAVLLAVGLLKIPQVCVKIFKGFGVGIKAVIIVGLVAGIFELLTGIKLIPYTAPIEEGASVIFNAAAVLTGAFPLVRLLSKVLDKPMKKLGGKLGINAVSAIGFLSTLASNSIAFGTMKDMDDKGVVLNAAFAVSAAFTFASHLGFTLSVNADYVACMIVGKLVAGVTALFVAQFLYKRIRKKEKV